MTHLTEATLRTYLDHELAEAERAVAHSHLAACGLCRAELTALEARAAEVQARLAALAPSGAEAARPAPAAWAQFMRKEKPTMFPSLLSPKLRPVWVSVTLLGVLAISLAFAPVRALASSFLGLFRVQQVSVLPVDTTRLNDLTGHAPLTEDISRMLSDSVTVTRPTQEPQAVGSAADASQAAGFSVRLPAEPPASQLTVQSGMAFQFKVDRAQAQALLDESGRQDLQLPASVDGALVKVDIPAGVTAAYGACPQPSAQTADPGEPGSTSRSFPDCVIFAQMPSPTVAAPPDLDLAQLAELGLQITTGMSAEEAREYSQTVDWATTLVIPIPRNGTTYAPVAVDGVTGYLIQRPADAYPEYALVWVKDGIIYAIGALGSDTAKALALADTLK